ncbi:hypothetical protein L6452_05964 [Arctium lappa]|uniref:Uncharacterized protein n=1 Tax=Arctium lappa TaxID=4217 RepID=A0ACB9EIJ2_ARCLA|nr:hypothetical protein L6452_05964 [Arctium lappa]
MGEHSGVPEANFSSLIGSWILSGDFICDVHPNISCCDGEYTSCCKTTGDVANTTTYGNIVGRKGSVNRDVPLVVSINP